MHFWIGNADADGDRRRRVSGGVILPYRVICACTMHSWHVQSASWGSGMHVMLGWVLLPCCLFDTSDLSRGLVLFAWIKQWNRDDVSAGDIQS